MARKNVNDKGGEQLSRTVNGNFGVDRKGIWKDLFFSTCYEDSLGRYLIFLEVLDFQNFLVLENTWSKFNLNAYALYSHPKSTKLIIFLFFQNRGIKSTEMSEVLIFQLYYQLKEKNFSLSVSNTMHRGRKPEHSLAVYTKNLRFSTRLRKKKIEAGGLHKPVERLRQCNNFERFDCCVIERLR